MMILNVMALLVLVVGIAAMWFDGRAASRRTVQREETDRDS